MYTFFSSILVMFFRFTAEIPSTKVLRMAKSRLWSKTKKIRETLRNRGWPKAKIRFGQLWSRTRSSEKFWNFEWPKTCSDVAKGNKILTRSLEAKGQDHKRALIPNETNKVPHTRIIQNTWNITK
jgi:hypothetical protein